MLQVRKKTPMSVRTRFAPSPTGPLHLGGVRTALYCYLFTKHQGGQFLLRIEDTDQNRFVEGAEQYINDALAWAGIPIDEGVNEGGNFGPYKQSERKHLYKQYVDQLIENGNAYIAFDTPEELEAMREQYKAQGVPNPAYNGVTRQYMKNSLALPKDEVDKRLAENQPFVVRLKMPRNEEIRFEDKVRGWVVFHSSQLDDKVIFKSDGMPTYHLANVVDDYLMQITHVIRGEEWLPSTPTHIMLYKALGWEDKMPAFAHLPLILKPDGHGKLSKRDGDRLGFPVFPLNWTNPETGEVSQGYKERGFLPEAFVNMLAFLGWNPGTNQELFTMDELIQAFSIERIGKSGAKFDFEKAKWYNQQFIKMKSDDDLYNMVAPMMQSQIDAKGTDYVKKYISFFKERVTFLEEFPTVGYFMFEAPKTFDEKVVQTKWNDNVKPLFEDLINQFQALPNFTHDAIEQTVKQAVETNGLKIGMVFPVLRVMLTGEAGGPPLFELIEMLGQATTVSRMQAFVEKYNIA